MSSNRRGRKMSADEEKAYDSSIHQGQQNSNIDSSARLPNSASSRAAQYKPSSNHHNRYRSPHRSNRVKSRSPYRHDKKRSRSPYRHDKPRSRSPYRADHTNEKRRHDGDHYSAKHASDPRRFKAHHVDEVDHSRSAGQSTDSNHVSNRGRSGDKREWHGREQQQRSRSPFRHDKDTAAGFAHEGAKAVGLNDGWAARGYGDGDIGDKKSIRNDVDTQDNEKTAPQLSDAELIEQRRKRREAIKAKHRAQPTLLVKALEPKLSPTPTTPIEQNASEASTAGSPSPIPASPQTPGGGSAVGSPRPLIVVNEEDMLKRGVNEADLAEDQGPSAADYDPSMDMQEDRRDLVNQDSSAPEDSTKQVADVDMFAADDDDDDMFADETATSATKTTAQAKALDQSLLDNWDFPDGHIRVIIGELLNGKYAIKQQIGKGTFATVVRAEDINTGQMVAIKIACNNDTMHKAGMQEMDFLTVLNSSDPDDKRHIIRLLAHFEHKGHLCLVFESLHADLREILKKHGRNVGLNLIALRSFAYSIFQALLHMQRNEILHADLKPDNILISERMNQLKICDFGTASKLKDAEVTPYLVSRFYRAPEVMLGITLDYAIDMWSIGCTLYELYTGRILFTGADNNQMLKSIQECRGKIPIRMLKRSTLVDKHFDEFGNFVSVERDRTTGQMSYRQPNLTKIAPKKDLRSRIVESTPGNDASSTTQVRDFIDLLEKCLQLDPMRRISPADALRHSFVAQKATTSTHDTKKKRSLVTPALAPSSIR